MLPKTRNMPVFARRRPVQPERLAGDLQRPPAGERDLAKSVDGAQLCAIEQLRHRRNESERNAQLLTLSEPFLRGAFLESGHEDGVDPIGVEDAVGRDVEVRVVGQLFHTGQSAKAVPLGGRQRGHAEPAVARLVDGRRIGRVEAIYAKSIGPA